jgi:hypothetical protein
MTFWYVVCDVANPKISRSHYCFLIFDYNEMPFVRTFYDGYSVWVGSLLNYWLVKNNHKSGNKPEYEYSENGQSLFGVSKVIMWKQAFSSSTKTVCRNW